MLYLASLLAAAYLLYTAERNPIGLWCADRLDNLVAVLSGFGFAGPAKLIAVLAVPILGFALLYSWIHDWFWGLLGVVIVFASVCAGIRFDVARRLIDDIQIDWLRGDTTAAEYRLEEALEAWLPSSDADSLAQRLSFVEKALLLAVMLVFSGGFYFILLGPLGVVAHLVVIFYHHRSDESEADSVLAALLWLPSLVLATTFLLVGDFSAGAKALGRAWMEPSMPVHTALYSVAIASSPILADLDTFGDKPRLLDAFAGLVNMLRRSAVVWLLLFSVWVLLL